jgi:hypothetical protein
MKSTISLKLTPDANAEIHLAFTQDAICKLVDLNLKAIIHEFNSLEFEARTAEKLSYIDEGNEEK